MGAHCHVSELTAVRAHKPPHDRDIVVLSSPFCPRASQAFASGITYLEPGKVHEVHAHEVEEFVYILKGSGICEFCGETFRFRPGTVLQANSMEPHGFTNDGNETVEILWVTSPAGRERAFLKQE